MIRPTPSHVLTVVALVLAIAWSAVLAHQHLAAGATVLDRIEASLVDLRFLAAGGRPAPDDVLIVAVDNETAQYAKSFPLPRRVLAEVIDKLFAGGVKAIALDFLFLDTTTPEADAALSKALRGGMTVCAAGATFAQDAEVDPVSRDVIPQASGFDLPIPPLQAATALGSVNIAADLSGNPRHVPMLIAWNASLLAALPLRVVALATGSDPSFTKDSVTVGGVTTPLDVGRQLALRFYGREKSIQTISAVKILTHPLPPDLLRDKIVIIGATASGSGDRFPTPFDSVLPGVEVLATAIANLHSGDALVRTSTIRFADAAIMMFLAVAVVLLLTMRNIEVGLAGVAGLVVLLGVFATIAFARGYWFSLAMPLAAMTPVTIFTAAARLGLDSWTERKLRRHEAVLRAFQSPAIARELAANPQFLAQPVERDVAVMFLDLTGFTGMTERIGPVATRELLREFHNLVETEVLRGGGIVFSYMGDGAMIVWGMAGTGPNDAAQALRTAITLRERTLVWLQGVSAKATFPLGVKLGVHYGPAVLSRLGHATHQHITATGDTVNTASRLMEVAAERGFRLALSTGLMETATRQGFDFDATPVTQAHDVTIRGRERHLSVCFLVETDV